MSDNITTYFTTLFDTLYDANSVQVNDIVIFFLKLNFEERELFLKNIPSFTTDNLLKDIAGNRESVLLVSNPGDIYDSGRHKLNIDVIGVYNSPVITKSISPGLMFSDTNEVVEKEIVNICGVNVNRHGVNHLHSLETQHEISKPEYEPEEASGSSVMLMNHTTLKDNQDMHDFGESFAINPQDKDMIIISSIFAGCLSTAAELCRAFGLKCIYMDAFFTVAPNSDVDRNSFISTKHKIVSEFIEKYPSITLIDMNNIIPDTDMNYKKHINILSEQFLDQELIIVTHELIIKAISGVNHIIEPLDIVEIDDHFNQINTLHFNGAQFLNSGESGNIWSEQSDYDGELQDMINQLRDPVKK